MISRAIGGKSTDTPMAGVVEKCGGFLLLLLRLVAREGIEPPTP